MMDNEEKQSLLLFQLGPVQSFIAQAVALEDLASGSRLLSTLTWAGLQSIPEWSQRTIFPAVTETSTDEGIPNRFLVFVPAATAVACAENAEKAVRNKLQALAEATVKTLPEVDPKVFMQQVDHFLQITWAILRQPTGCMGKDYQAIGKLMAARRNVREFAAWPEEATGMSKDFLSGKEAALDKGLGAMNCIKRQLQVAQAKPLNQPDYMAVIAMDGDQMGVALSGFQTREEHQHFSSQLSAFSKAVETVLPATGTLIYAGGDDVLAIVPATDAVPTAKALSELFVQYLPNKTASAGIAIGHRKTPLQELVQAAHQAEHRAKSKSEYDRNALAVSIYKRSGEILEWGCKWTSAAFTLYAQVSGWYTQPKVAPGVARFPYKLAGFLAPYDLQTALPPEMEDVILADFRHAVEQTEGVRSLDMKVCEAYLKEIKDAHVANFLKFFLCVAFIYRPRGEAED